MVYNKMLSNTIDYVQQLSSQISRNTELMIDEASKVLQLGNSDISFNFLYATDDRQEETMELIKLFKLYRDSYVLSKDIKNVYIMGSDAMGFSERHGIYNIDKDENSRYLYDIVSQNENELLVLSGKELDGSDNNSIIIGKAIIQPGTHKQLGITVVEFEAKAIQSLYEDVTLGSTGRFAIVDNTLSQIISDNNNVDLTDIKDMLSEKDSGYFFYEQNTNKTLFIYETIPNTKWKIIGKVQISELMQDTYELGRIFAYAILLILVFLVVLYIIISKSLINPITKLRDNMLLAEKGDLNARVNVTGHDEIAVLARQYNRMLSHIQKLIEENKLEQRNLQKAELKALQAQINPHFLYNTLDTVIWLAAANENDKLINVVDQLAVFFRLGLSNGVEWINVKKEIEHVKSYLSIQQVRYSDMLKYDIEIDPQIYCFTMLKMILQPIVENALYHGIKQNENGGAISIKGKLKNQNDIIFEISDTGVGIEENFLMDLMNSIQKNIDTYRDNENGFGLYNVNRRIRLYYGEDYGISVWSQTGQGTVVTVLIRGEENGSKDL
jgi:two-component system sensor histidine kinase YesM